MQEIKNIIVPVDLGKHTEKIADFATYMASKFSARITFIHVIDSYAMGDMMLGSPSYEEFDRQRKTSSEELMDNLVTDNTGKCPDCAGTVLTGDIVDEIVAYAEKEQANLILIGTHGAKGLERILLGSVAQRVVKRAPCPTMIINPYR